MNFYALIPLASFLLILFVWSFVLGQRRRDPVNSAFLLFAGVGGTWIGLELLFYIPAFVGFEDEILRAVVPLWMSIGFLFMNFAYRLVERRPDAIYFVFLAATFIGVVIDLATDWVILGHHRYDWGVADVRDPLTHSAICTAPVASSLFGLWLVFDRWRKASEIQVKRPLSMVVFGGLVTLSGISVLDIILPNVFGILDFPRFGSSALALFTVVVYAAVTRYNFLSISVEHVAEELFEDVRDGIVLVDHQGKVRRMNRAAIEMLGTQTTGFAGRPVEDLLPGCTAEQDFRNRELAFDDQGSPQVLSVSQSSNTKKGVEIGKILILRDITEQKKAEELLRRSHNELEEEVRRRTEELRQAQKMEAIGTLAGGIAHDFNNLLAAILGFATAARDDLSSEHPLRSDLEEVVVAARRARDIVQQLLTFSRRDDAERSVVAVDQVLSEALKLLRVSLPPTIKIERDVEDAACTVRADQAQLHQVLMNLCTNAYQAMGDSGGVLGVSLKLIDLDEQAAASHPPLAAGRHVRVTISDTGHGMTSETAERIFDPFFTTKSDGTGTGLGLATVQRILQAHGGTIDVQSEVGQGSAFSIYLPWIAGDTSLEDSMNIPVEGGNERLMFIDDREQVARAGKRMLEALGYRVDTFTSPTEALEVFNGDPWAYDLVITDQVMPEMTGLELAGEMLRVRPRVPIVLISGNADERTREQMRALGIGTFLPKPLAKGSTDRVIRALLAGAGQPSPR
jgi:PAS domain S-box-containing protein